MTHTITRRAKILKWNFNYLNYDGLFGWEKFKADKFAKINDGIIIFEVKKVIEKSEYGYWHAISQAILYEFLQRDTRVDFLILCVVFDWGRKSHESLNENEKRFLNQFKEKKIFFVRISMGSSPFIEHNLKDEWTVIRED
jgi:hypothetical protein